MQTISTLSLMAFVGILATQTGPTAKPDDTTQPSSAKNVRRSEFVSNTGDMTCKTTLTAGQSYLEYPSSPLENMKLYDSVFYAKVVAPIRNCRLGHCVGMKVSKAIKGSFEKSILVRIPHLPKDGCDGQLFSKKGESWLVFSNRGTSAKGVTYYQLDYDGPSIRGRSPSKSGLAELENRYHERRNKLDQAINDGLSPNKKNKL